MKTLKVPAEREKRTIVAGTRIIDLALPQRWGKVPESGEMEIVAVPPIFCMGYSETRPVANHTHIAFPADVIEPDPDKEQPLILGWQVTGKLQADGVRNRKTVYWSEPDYIQNPLLPHWADALADNPQSGGFYVTWLHKGCIVLITRTEITIQSFGAKKRALEVLQECQKWASIPKYSYLLERLQADAVGFEGHILGNWHHIPHPDELIYLDKPLKAPEGEASADNNYDAETLEKMFPGVERQPANVTPETPLRSNFRILAIAKKTTPVLTRVQRLALPAAEREPRMRWQERSATRTRELLTVLQKVAVVSGITSIGLNPLFTAFIDPEFSQLTEFSVDPNDPEQTLNALNELAVNLGETCFGFFLQSKANPDVIACHLSPYYNHEKAMGIGEFSPKQDQKPKYKGLL